MGFRKSLLLLMLTLGPMVAHAINIDLASTDDLSSLSIGETVTIEVILSGLTPGENLSALGVQLAYDDALFSTSALTAGAVVPDITGFVDFSGLGIVDGVYDALLASSGGLINQNGVFYSFLATVLALGTGEFVIDDAAGFDEAGFFVSTQNGQSLTITAVPEPTTLALFGLGLADVSYRRYRRR